MKPVLILVKALTAAGASVASTDYTLVPRGGTLAQATWEVRDTLRWWRTKLNSDFGKKTFVAAMGLSAGVSPLFRASCAFPEVRPDAMIGIYGALKFRPEVSPVISVVYRKLLQTSNREEWEAHSASHIMEHNPYPLPVQLIHGKEDTVCPYQDSEELHHWRESQDLPSELHIHDDENHAFMNEANGIATRRTFQQMTNFLVKARASSWSDGCNLSS
jgi:acetyl esterase/lipase